MVVGSTGRLKEDTGERLCQQSAGKPGCEEFADLKPPGREAAVFACKIQTDPVARWIAQPCFAPQPTLVLSFGLKGGTLGFQRRDTRIQIIAFKIDMGAVAAILAQFQ